MPQAVNPKRIKRNDRKRARKRKIATKIKKEVSKLSEDKIAKETAAELIKIEENPIIKGDEQESYDADKMSDSKLKEIKGFRHREYTLYKKEIEIKSGKKRTVRFFSKAEPEEGEPIELPKGYKIKENKKTGVPYLTKKK